MSEWQPIETAPMDGTMFLAWVQAQKWEESDEGVPIETDVSYIDFCVWHLIAKDMGDGGWWDPLSGPNGDTWTVTHWMPLPSPPVTSPAMGDAHE